MASKIFLKLTSKINSMYLSVSVRLKNSYSRPPNKFTKFIPTEVNDSENNLSEEMPEDDEVYNKIVKRTFRIPDMGHNVLILQPYIKWGPDKRTNTTPELQLEEAVALIKTLRHWTVADKLTVPLLTFDRGSLFGKGTLQKLKEKIETDEKISAVFISLEVLKGIQRTALEAIFQVPIYDRYSIVIQILREHATSREAKLQLKLSEIPYLRGRIRSESPVSGGSELTLRLNALRDKEKSIREEIKELRAQRGLLRKKRRKMLLPVVAVVGYTNSGKTSLIKALTGEDKLRPENYLFATLDVTMHGGLLPCGLKILYADTIGFMSDLPTGLLECFTATLEDALLADVVVHVRDASHPDAKSQNDHVQQMLRQLVTEDLTDNAITVANKIDLIEKLDPGEFRDAIQISALKGWGLNRLVAEIENRILARTGRCRMVLKVRQAGPEYLWLRREAVICGEKADNKNSQMTLIEVIIDEATLEKFKHKFIYNCR